MKRVIGFLVTGLLIVLVSASAFAAGGKNHGEKGSGEVHQCQIRNSDEGTPAF